jgi:riboflavin synthase
MDATRSRSTVSQWRSGTRLNLERALKASDRFGGHIVQGHVDAVGRVQQVREGNDALLIDVDVGPELEDLMIAHGSIAIDGVSLTINELPAAAVAQVAIIEYTRSHTTLGDLREGSAVNIEGDVIGKYVKRLLGASLRPAALDLRPST